MNDTAGAGIHECDNCGARLPAPDAKGTRTCGFCKSVYTPPVAAPAAAPPQINVVFGGSGPGSFPTAAPRTEFRPVNPPSKKQGGGCLRALLVISFIAATAALPLYFGLKESGFNVFDPMKPSYDFGNQMVVLPGEPAANPSFLTVSTRYDGGRTVGQVLRFNGTDNKAVWSSADVADIGDSSPITVDGTNAYVVAEAKIFAFKLSDGSQLWQSALSDSLSWSSCQDCLQAIGPRVIVRTTDGNLQAFDTATGAPSWSRMLESSSADLIRTTANLVVIDQDLIVSIDLSTGANGPVFDPVCPRPQSTEPDHADASFDDFMASPSGASLLAFFGNMPSCIQSFNPDTGALEWGVSIDDPMSFSSSSLALSESAEGLLIGQSGRLGIIGPEHTAYRDIIRKDSTTFIPLGVAGTNAIAEVKDNRGTPKTSITGIDLGSGMATWEVSLGKSTTVDGPLSSPSTSASYDGTFTARLDGLTVRILTMTEGQSYNHTLSVDSIDTTTGNPAPRVTFDADSHDLIPSFGPPAWQGTKVVTRVGDDSMQIIDTATGTRVFRAP